MTSAVTSGCGGPIPTVETPLSAVPASDPPAGVEAQATGPAFHTITVTLCPREEAGCRGMPPVNGERGGGSGGGTPAYRVSFGSGAGALRSRDQAVADLYREIRDRTGLGGHLAAEARHLALSPTDAGSGAGGGPHARTPGSDPLVDAAFQLIEAVDTEGQVTVDAARGRADCKLSLLAAGATDGGAGRCVIREPSREGKIAPETPRRAERKFGQ